MQPFDATAIAALNLPVLCIDTCSLLDIMRDPTRDGAHSRDRLAALDLVQRLENREIVCLLAQQVQVEFGGHDARVQAEAAMTIRKLREKVDQVNQIHAAFLPTVSVNLSHLDGMVAASRQVVTRWMARAYDVTSSTNALANAWNRVNQNISPSRQGKDSMKDCVVLETYLAAMDELRAAGLVRKAVFLSSNTREYLSESRVLKADLVADFARVGSDYAPNMPAAKATLGL